MCRQQGRISYDKCYRSLPQMVANCADGYLFKLFFKPSKSSVDEYCLIYSSLCEFARSPNFILNMLRLQDAMSSTVVVFCWIQRAAAANFLKHSIVPMDTSPRYAILQHVNLTEKWMLISKTSVFQVCFDSVRSSPQNVFLHQSSSLHPFQCQLHLQRFPKYDPLDRSGLRSHFVLPSNTCCQ